MFYRFDRVLIDAPCSGLGVIRRKPDIKWSKNPEDLAALKIEQANILRVCSKYVKPDGILLYSTCSIEPEENQEVVEAFLRENGDFVFDDLRPCLPEKLRAAVDKHVGCLQLYPHIHKVDGFFIARLRRVKV
jgi:16S rRNA (cytosine967-C5)-methyltransferase